MSNKDLKAPKAKQTNEDHRTEPGTSKTVPEGQKAIFPKSTKGNSRVQSLQEADSMTEPEIR